MQRMHGWVGRKDRESVAIDAVVHWSDGSTAPVKLTDFSDEGCRIEADHDALGGAFRDTHREHPREPAPDREVLVRIEQRVDQLTDVFLRDLAKSEEGVIRHRLPRQ